MDDVDFLCHVLYAIYAEGQPEGPLMAEDIFAAGGRATAADQIRGAATKCTTYIIQTGTEPAGTVWVVRTPERHEITGLHLLRTYRGHGIGTAVITPLLQEARQRKFPLKSGSTRTTPPRNVSTHDSDSGVSVKWTMTTG